MTSAVGRVVLKSSFVGVASKRRDVARIRGARTNGARANAFFKNPLRQDPRPRASSGRRDETITIATTSSITSTTWASWPWRDRTIAWITCSRAACTRWISFCCSRPAEGDTPKIEEILAAGADKTVKDLDGKSVAELAGRDNPDKRDAVLALLK